MAGSAVEVRVVAEMGTGFGGSGRGKGRRFGGFGHGNRLIGNGCHS